MKRTTLAASCLTLVLGLSGCAGRVYTETEYVEPSPLVVDSTVYVEHSHPHYYRRGYCGPRVAVVEPRRYCGHGYYHYDRRDSDHRSHGEWARRGGDGRHGGDGSTGGGSTGGGSTGGGSTGGGVAGGGSGGSSGGPADHHDNGRRAHGDPSRSADNHDYGRRGNGNNSNGNGNGNGRGRSSEASARDEVRDVTLSSSRRGHDDSCPRLRFAPGPWGPVPPVTRPPAPPSHLTPDRPAACPAALARRYSAARVRR